MITKTFDILPEIILEYLFQPNVSTASLTARWACSDVYLETNTEEKWQRDDNDGPGEGSKKPTTLFFSFL